MDIQQCHHQQDGDGRHWVSGYDQVAGFAAASGETIEEAEAAWALRVAVITEDLQRQREKTEKVVKA